MPTLELATIEITYPDSDAEQVPVFTSEEIHIGRDDVRGAAGVPPLLPEVVTKLASDVAKIAVKEYPEVENICVITKWGYEWLKRAVFGGESINKFTKKAIHELDVEDNDPCDYIETHTYTNQHDVKSNGVFIKSDSIIRKKLVLSKGKRTKFASCVAHIAYNKFGNRAMSEANVLVTRRWIQKLLEEPEYKDLRTVDKNIAIDRALFLSFVPTNEFRKMKIAVATNEWQKRVDPKGLLAGIFGRAFMVVKDDVPDTMRLC